MQPSDGRDFCRRPRKRRARKRKWNVRCGAGFADKDGFLAGRDLISCRCSRMLYRLGVDPLVAEGVEELASVETLEFLWFARRCQTDSRCCGLLGCVAVAENRLLTSGFGWIATEGVPSS